MKRFVTLLFCTIGMLYSWPSIAGAMDSLKGPAEKLLDRQLPQKTPHTPRPATFSPSVQVKQPEPNVATGTGQSANSDPALLPALSTPSNSKKSGTQPLIKWSFSAGPMKSLAISPDGKLLASGGSDGSIHIWSLSDGNPISKIAGHTNAPKVKVKMSSVNSLAFSSDGSLLVSGGDDGMVKLWNPITGTLVRTFSGHTDPVHSVTISPDNRILASGSGGWFDYTARLWDVQSGTNTKIFPVLGIGYVVKFTPDGKSLIASGWDSVYRIDLATNKMIRIIDFSSKHQPVNSITISSDGHFAFLACQNIVKVWDFQTGRLLGQKYEIPLKSRGQSTDFPEIMSIALTPDGTTLITSAGRNISFWHTGSAKIFDEFTFIRDLDSNLAMSKNSKLMAGATRDGKVNVWNIESNIAKSEPISVTIVENDKVLGTQTVGTPDLIPTAVRVSDNAIKPGQTVNIAWTMINKGDGRAGSSVTGLRLRPVGSVGATLDITLVREIATLPLDPGRSINQQHPVTVPEDIPAGSYVFLVIADNSAASTLGQKESSNDYAPSGEVAITCQSSSSSERPLVAKMEPVADSGFVDSGYARTEAKEHLGTDYRAVGGACVYAMLDGKVEENDTTENPDPMQAVLKVIHADGSKTMYGHIESSLSKGSDVSHGMYLGTVRHTTANFGSHLHYGEWSPPTDKSIQDQKDYDKACVHTKLGTWGWGRAPLGTSREQILKCGWVDTGAKYGWVEKLP